MNSKCYTMDIDDCVLSCTGHWSVFAVRSLEWVWLLLAYEHCMCVFKINQWFSFQAIIQSFTTYPYATCLLKHNGYCFCDIKCALKKYFTHIRYRIDLLVVEVYYCMGHCTWLNTWSSTSCKSIDSIIIVNVMYDSIQNTVAAQIPTIGQIPPGKYHWTNIAGQIPSDKYPRTNTIDKYKSDKYHMDKK